MPKGNRYKDSIGFRGAEFQGFRHRKIGRATGVIEYTVKEGDRLDLLSQYFYKDSRKWWRILDANPGILFGMDLVLEKYIGETIAIPKADEAGMEQ